MVVKSIICTKKELGKKWLASIPELSDDGHSGEDDVRMTGRSSSRYNAGPNLTPHLHPILFFVCLALFFTFSSRNCLKNLSFCTLIAAYILIFYVPLITNWFVLIAVKIWCQQCSSQEMFSRKHCTSPESELQETSKR